MPGGERFPHGAATTHLRLILAECAAFDLGFISVACIMAFDLRHAALVTIIMLYAARSDVGEDLRPVSRAVLRATFSSVLKAAPPGQRPLHLRGRPSPGRLSALSDVMSGLQAVPSPITDS